jgi:hypothetical protein
MLVEMKAPYSKITKYDELADEPKYTRAPRARLDRIVVGGPDEIFTRR